jgi:heat shock protein HslJ
MKINSYPKPRLIKLIVCLSLLAALILTGCFSGATQAPPPTNTSSSIQNVIWQWVSVTNQTTNVVTTVPSPSNYTISFYPDGTLTGKADCNTINGTYSQQNGFSIKLGASTMASCGEASLDQQYVNLLGNVAAGGPEGPVASPWKPREASSACYLRMEALRSSLRSLGTVGFSNCLPVMSRNFFLVSVLKYVRIS